MWQHSPITLWQLYAPLFRLQLIAAERKITGELHPERAIAERERRLETVCAYGFSRTLAHEALEQSAAAAAAAATQERVDLAEEEVGWGRRPSLHGIEVVRALELLMSGALGDIDALLER
eukprot:SAG11_NODE_218_length_12212_cov_7.026005_3_plen_120_part_00